MQLYIKSSDVWSQKDHLIYKNSLSPDQNQGQFNFYDLQGPHPVKVTVKALMNSAYDDAMADLCLKDLTKSVFENLKLLLLLHHY
jgi:hypothetical protein